MLGPQLHADSQQQRTAAECVRSRQRTQDGGLWETLRAQRRGSTMHGKKYATISLFIGGGTSVFGLAFVTGSGLY